MKGKYLNEKNYQRGNRKIKTAALLVFLAGLLVGGGLITLGVAKGSSIAELEETQKALEAKCDEEYENSRFDFDSFSTKSFSSSTKSSTKAFNQYSKCTSEAFDMNTQIGSAEFVRLILFIVGGFIIITSTAIAIRLYLITKARAITAYSTQAVAPVAKEGIEKYGTPVMAKAAESIAEGIARGIQKGKSAENAQDAPSDSNTPTPENQQ